MLVMVDYVRDMTVKKPCMVNMDRLSICFSCDISLDDLYLHPKSQLLGKSKADESIFLEIFLLIWMKFSLLP